MSVGISLYQSISVRIGIYQSVSVCITPYQYISVYISLYRSVSVNIRLYQSISLSISLYHSVSVCVSLYQSTSVYVSRYQSTSIYISPYQPISVSDITLFRQQEKHYLLGCSNVSVSFHRRYRKKEITITNLLRCSSSKKNLIVKMNPFDQRVTYDREQSINDDHDDQCLQQKTNVCWVTLCRHVRKILFSMTKDKKLRICITS